MYNNLGKNREGKRMKFIFLDEKQTPHMDSWERLLTLIYLMGITTTKQLEIVTGWKTQQVRDRLVAIRKKGNYLETWRSAPRKPFYYTLKSDGIEYACAIRRETFQFGNKKKKAHRKGQAGHFIGFNNILCRLIENQVDFSDFMFGKEVLKHLRFVFKKVAVDETNRIKSEYPRLPFRPDGLVTINEKSFYLEYDTGSEAIGQLIDRIENYVEGYQDIQEKDRLPVVWITVGEARKKKIEAAGKEIKEKYPKRKLPIMIAFVEAEEVDFFSGKVKAIPFLK
jgi:hypothetical protein